MTLPEAVAQHEDRFRAGGVIAGGVQQTAQQGGRPEILKEVRADEGGVERLLFPFYRQARGVEGKDDRERAGMLPKKGQFGVGQCKGVGLRRVPVEAQQACGIPHR